jgi:hypothetical protein
MTLLIGGAIGGFIGRKKEMPLWQQMFSVFTAAFIANYTAPVLIEFMALSDKTLPGMGFIVGYSGKHLLDYGLGKIKKKVKTVE